MALWIDQKYLNLLSSRLKGFVKKNSDLWNSRCPICDDSQRSQRLKRFYIYPGQDQYSQDLCVKCHNCGYSNIFKYFLKEFDPILYSEYALENAKENLSPQRRTRSPQNRYKQKSSTLPSTGDHILSDLPRLSELDREHPAIQYCIKRKIPTFAMQEFRWTYDFQEVARRLNKEAAKDLYENDPRIIIPFYDQESDVNMFQGRTLKSNVNPKYITIKQNDSVEKVYGMNRVDKTKPIIVMEGPIDSLFVENAIATGDADLTRFKDGQSYVFDNQPRNKQIVKRIEKTIKQGYPVFVWPSYLSEGKDINEMIIDNVVNENEIRQIILDNTFQGLKAQIEFNRWKKV